MDPPPLLILGKFAKIVHDQGGNRPLVQQNFHKQGISYQAIPLNLFHCILRVPYGKTGSAPDISGT